MSTIKGLGRLVPYFQPIVPLPWSGDGEIIHETLARIITPDGLVLTPDEFLGTRLSFLQADKHILHLISSVQDAHRNETFSINSAPSSICDVDYFDTLSSMILSKELDSSRLVIEVTEEWLAGSMDMDLIDKLDMLRSFGLRVALDDFGAGGSGLARLALCHFDIIKLSNLMDITTRRSKIIIEGLASLLESLSGQDSANTLVIEGIENQKQMDALIHIGASHIQGNILMPAHKSIQEVKSLMDRVCSLSSSSIQILAV